jgi:ferredoxin-thioredoxin reductase catalytic subunit
MLWRGCKNKMKKEDKKEKELIKKSKDYAKEQGFKLNPDKKIVGLVIKGLLNNKEKKGELYCPCRMTSGDKKKDMQIICPCIFHLTEIKEDGKCHCKLFVK